MQIILHLNGSSCRSQQTVEYIYLIENMAQ